jgi:hypothetical protein
MNGNEYGCYRDGNNIHFKRHSHDGGIHSNMSTIIPVPMWNNQDDMGMDKPVTESAMMNIPNVDRTDKKGSAYNPFRKEKTAADIAKINKAKERESKSKAIYKTQDSSQRKKTVSDLMKLVKHIGEESILESAPFKDLKSAVHYASEKVKTHRDHEDGIEVYKHKAGGYDVNHTMNANGRNALHGSGAKHLGTVYRDKQFNIKHNIKEETEQIDELSTDLLAKYKTASHANAKASDEAGNYAKGDKRFAGINKATRKQFDNDLKKHGQYVKEDIYSSDTRTKKVQVQDKDGNWVFKDRKSHPHKINFAASKMNGKPAQPEDPTKVDTETAYQNHLDKQAKLRANEAWVLNPDGKAKKKYKDIKDNKTMSNSITTPPFDAFSNTNNQT